MCGWKDYDQARHAIYGSWHAARTVGWNVYLVRVDGSCVQLTSTLWAQFTARSQNRIYRPESSKSHVWEFIAGTGRFRIVHPGRLSSWQSTSPQTQLCSWE